MLILPHTSGLPLSYQIYGQQVNFQRKQLFPWFSTSAKPKYQTLAHFLSDSLLWAQRLPDSLPWSQESESSNSSNSLKAQGFLHQVQRREDGRVLQAPGQGLAILEQKMGWGPHLQ